MSVTLSLEGDILIDSTYSEPFSVTVPRMRPRVSSRALSVIVQASAGFSPPTSVKSKASCCAAASSLITDVRRRAAERTAGWVSAFITSGASSS